MFLHEFYVHTILYLIYVYIFKSWMFINISMYFQCKSLRFHFDQYFNFNFSNSNLSVLKAKWISSTWKNTQKRNYCWWLFLFGILISQIKFLSILKLATVTTDTLHCKFPTPPFFFFILYSNRNDSLQYFNYFLLFILKNNY